MKLDESNLRAVQVTFEFLDANDGVVVEVLHQGSNPVAIEGTIVGASFRDKGTALLTPRALRMVAAKTLPARAKLVFSGRSKYLLIAVIGMLISMSGLAFFTFNEILNNRATAPISIEGMDLTTLDGQRQFVTAASEAKLLSFKADNLWIPMSLMTGLPLLALVALTGYALRPAIPTSITHDIVEEETSNQEV